MTSTTKVALVALVALVAQTLGLVAGWWWVSMLAGLAAGLLIRRRLGLLVASGTALVAWGGVLLWRTGGDVGRAGDVVGALALDARGLGAAVAALTLVYGVLLALVGFWVGWLARTQWGRRSTFPATAGAHGERVDGVEAASAVGHRPHPAPQGRPTSVSTARSGASPEQHQEEKV